MQSSPVSMNSLGELDDILETITPDTSDSILETDDFLDALFYAIEEYVADNIQKMMECDFHELMHDELFELTTAQFGEEIPYYQHDDLHEKIDDVVDMFFSDHIPPRSHEDTHETRTMTSTERRAMKYHLRDLHDKPQPAQRTTEWYEFRHNLITASNAYKVFMGGASYNQILYEKCQPIKLPPSGEAAAAQTVVNVETTLHWGQKYEDVSVMIYEDLFGTKVDDFGCIQHDTYSFLGASPDGINISDTNPRFGRMLEIKNIVNRDITGIPKLEYWVQMQLQMETCDLDECDFLETRFKEYEGESEYFQDACGYDGVADKSAVFVDATREQLAMRKYKGIIMYFSRHGKPDYKYSPLNMCDPEEIEKWEARQHASVEHQDVVWVKNIYWRLDEMSCVLVLRNKIWFQESVGRLDTAWKTIEKERVSGFAHRAPVKRARVPPKNTVGGTAWMGGECLLKLGTSDDDDDDDDEDDVIVENDADSDSGVQDTAEDGIINRTPQRAALGSMSIMVVDKIRTESMDETKKKMSV